MRRKTKFVLVSAAAFAVVAMAAGSRAQQADMTFFISSVGSGKGGDLGGLAGADAHCTALAAKAGAKAKTWRAYLSTSGDKAVNARDRIGKGPWKNAKGLVVATSVDDLHSDNNKLSKENSLNESGGIVNGRGDKPNQHDILTGSTMDGRAIAGEEATCSNWTSSTSGTAMLGHHDRQGLKDDAPSKSWNSSHKSKGCSQDALISTGGAGLIYCFAAN